MQCLWPSERVTIGKALALVLMLGLTGVIAWCLVTSPSPSRVLPQHTPLSQLEKALGRVPAHTSEFSTVSAPLALPKCASVQPPEALFTPDPLLQVQDDLQVRVSFIVGSDGLVHSAFILDGGGTEEDQIVLHAVRVWRYRPALCNGVPTDAEAQIRFSIP
ncbi:MAG: TonB family protein [Terriglobales bacterium]|jgi:TonB family protein